MAPPPDAWRAAFRLDNVSLADPDDPDSVLEVVYWCEAVRHWFVASFRAETAEYVHVQG